MVIVKTIYTYSTGLTSREQRYLACSLSMSSKCKF